MFEPSFRTTAKLMKSLREIDDTRKLVATIPVLPIVETRIQERALVETVHHTTRIEGNRLDIRTVERLGARQVLKVGSDRDEQEVLNLYEVMRFIKHIADQQDIPIDEAVIKEIHAKVVKDIPREGPPGTYRLGQNAIEDETTGEHIFMPPGPSDVEPLMSDFSAWLSQQPQVVHPIIAAGIAHLELVAVHPFDDGNGRTARALADLILYRYGFGLRYFFSWVAQMGIDMDNYHRTLRQVLGSEYQANIDPTIWLEYFAEAVAKSLTKERPELERIHKAFVDAYNLGAKKGLSRDQVEASIYARIYGSVTTGLYVAVTGLSRSTVVKRLSQLVEVGIMRVEGKGRNVRYVPVLDETLTGE